MHPGRVARNLVFLARDAVQGFPIKRHLLQLELPECHPQKHAQLYQAKLDKLLRHAVNTTPFYKPYAGFQNLSDFPLIGKKELKEHYDDFFSTSYDRKKLVKTETSGSTGRPFVYYMTKYKINRRMAEVLHYNRQAGYALGMPFAQVRTNVFSDFYKWMTNSVIIDPTRVNADWLQEQRDILINGKIEFLIGWPSVLVQIASWCQEHGDKPSDFSLKGIVCSAEPFTPHMRRLFNNVFGVPAYDRYATQELGIVANECKKCNAFHINKASHYVELLSMHNDNPAAPGEPGRIVVTDLNSFAMPLIRYEIGDIAISDGPNANCNCAQTIRNIQGRVNDLIYNPRGENVNWAAIQDIIEKDSRIADAIVQYQFVQEGVSDYCLNIIPGLAQELQDITSHKLLELLGENANIRFDFVEHIPTLSSGKCPTILNQYNRRLISTQQ